MTAVDLQAWSAGLAELHRRIARRFGRAEPRERVLVRDDAVSRSREAARRLHEQGLPHRDIGVLLGVSHQAVGKLLAG